MIKNYSKHLSFVHLVFTIMSPNVLKNQLMRHARCICTAVQVKGLCLDAISRSLNVGLYVRKHSTK